MSKKLVTLLNKEKDRTNKFISGDKIVKDVELLLLEEGEKENEVLSTLGLDHQVEYTRTLKEDIQRTEAVKKVYNQEVYTFLELHKLCNIYSLKVLEAKYYNGTIPPELSRKVEEFCKEKNIAMEGNKFFILAPEEQFRTLKSVPVQADPIMFYSPEYNGYSLSNRDTFIQVHNWGNDFGFLRKYRWMTTSWIPRSDDLSIRGSLIIALVALAVMLVCNFIHPILGTIANVLWVLEIYFTYTSAIKFKKDFLDTERFSTNDRYSNL
jgi:hypothetical protein